MENTDITNLSIKDKKEFYDSGATLDVNFRLESLKKLKEAIKKHEQDIFYALKKDLNKCEVESFETEIGQVYSEITYMIKHLKKLCKISKVKTPISQAIASSYIINEPYGVVLIIAPWNYPINLTFSPLIGAIAGGNCVTIKPSEYALESANIIAKIIKETFPLKYISVVLGDVNKTTALLNEKFDYIFFTGSVNVGKIIMSKAAETLTPVTLELGGKSPCVVTSSTNLKLAAKRIAFGKLLNMGQTCVAPDYILVDSSVHHEFVTYLKEEFDKYLVNSEKSVHIINKKNFDRLINLIDKSKVICGGNYNNENLYIEPTIMDKVNFDDKIMEDEIFGPIMPVITYDSLLQAKKYIKSKPRPLALYIFGKNKKEIKEFITTINYGGGCINDTLVHISTPHLPFGGIGNSGMGSYHGKYSFYTFTHQKSIMNKSNAIDLKIRYNMEEKNLKILRKVLK